MLIINIPGDPFFIFFFCQKKVYKSRLSDSIIKGQGGPMNYKKTVLISLALGSGLALNASAVAATASAEMLAYTCAGCHGTDGSSNGPGIPTIAGASEEYLNEIMMAYRNGERASTIMERIAKGYSDEEIKAMSAFFAKQPFKVFPQEHDPKLAKAGAKLHKKYCEKCHAEGGTSAEDDSGILAGQWMPYLEYTMADYQSGRLTPTKKMKKKMEKLEKKEGAEGYKKLIHFYGSAK